MPAPPTRPDVGQRHSCPHRENVIAVHSLKRERRKRERPRVERMATPDCQGRSESNTPAFSNHQSPSDETFGKKPADALQIGMNSKHLLQLNSPGVEGSAFGLEFAPVELPLNVREAAVYLGVSIQTVYLWVERKQIPHLRVMGRNIRFLKSDLEPFRATFKQEVGIVKT